MSTAGGWWAAASRMRAAGRGGERAAAPRRRSGRAHATATRIGILALLAGCAREAPPGPAVERLARGYVADAGVREERAWSEAGPGLSLAPGPGPASVWVRAEVARADWARHGRLGGRWSVPRAFAGNGFSDAGEPAFRLLGGTQALAFVALTRGKLDPRAIEPGTFGIVAGRVLAHFGTDADAEPPATVRLEEALELGRTRDGVNHVALGEFSGEGFVLAPGLPVRLERELDGPAWLRFLAVAETLAEDALTLRVRLDGEAVGEFVLDARAPQAVELALAAEPGRHALAFEVHGAPGLAGVLAPTLAPRAEAAQPAEPAAAPRDERPDLVLFQGDTFRADNLAAHGGDPAIAPQLNEFAHASVRFAEARSTSSWTLPAHVSMFAGLLPHQARVTTLNDRLGEEAVTLAEVLQAAGYRTGAISDGAFVTPAFGLGQGFEVFDARLKSPEQTLAAVRAFLELDDGRPLFLFVQSYRAHHPYKPDPEAAPETLRALGLRADLDLAEFAERAPSIADWHPGWTPAPAEAQRMRDYEALYRTASHALDRLFGATRALLAERSGTVLVFTSDHGEAFWEHGVAEHGNGVWGELVRVPLLVSAPGLAPGVRAQPASLVDLPRTLCALAGVAPAPQWGGVDLFAAPSERTLFAFECDLRGGASSLALLADGKTLIASDPPESEPTLEAAFDLTQDPLERSDRRQDPWAPQLFEALRAELAAARRPHLAGTASAPDADVLGDLQQLGYTGD